MELQPDHVVEFPNPDGSVPQTVNKLRVLSEKKLSDGTRIIKINRSDLASALKVKTSMGKNRSPLFKIGNDRKALAGGIFVTLNEVVSEEERIKFFEKENLIVKKKYQLYGKPTLWLIDAPAGLESLALANQLKEQHPEMVLSAEPNFWQQLTTRELRPSQRPPSPNTASKVRRPSQRK
jgi:hypothetical protein